MPEECLKRNETPNSPKHGQKGVRVVLGRTCRGLTGWFPLLKNFSVAIYLSPHICFILVLILISMFLT